MLMKTLDNSITGNGLAYLKSIIGHKLLSYSHQPFNINFKPANDFFMRLGLVCSNGVFVLDNRVDWEDDWFCSPDYTPHFVFNKIEDKREFANYGGFSIDEMVEFPVNEQVTDIILVQDGVLVFKSNTPYEEIRSTEGVIFVTNKRQYAFYKENTWLNETTLEFKGHNVLSKLEAIKDHWDVFAKPYDGTVKRKLIYLASEKEEIINEENIVGDTYEKQ